MGRNLHEKLDIMILANGKSFTLQEVSSEAFSKFNKLISVIDNANCESTALQCSQRRR